MHAHLLHMTITLCTSQPFTFFLPFHTSLRADQCPIHVPTTCTLGLGLISYKRGFIQLGRKTLWYQILFQALPSLQTASKPHVSLGHQTPWRWRGSAGPAVLCLTSALGTRHLDADVVQPDPLYYASRQPWAPDTLTVTWFSRTRCIMPHVSLGHQTPWRWRGPAGPAVICLTSALDTRHLDGDVVQPDPL